MAEPSTPSRKGALDGEGSGVLVEGSLSLVPDLDADVLVHYEVETDTPCKDPVTLDTLKELVAEGKVKPTSRVPLGLILPETLPG